MMTGPAGSVMIHDRDRIAETHQRVLTPARRHVAPAVVAAGRRAREGGERQVLEQRHVGCRKVLSTGRDGRGQREGEGEGA